MNTNATKPENQSFVLLALATVASGQVVINTLIYIALPEPQF